MDGIIAGYVIRDTFLVIILWCDFHSFHANSSSMTLSIINGFSAFYCLKCFSFVAKFLPSSIVALVFLFVPLCHSTVRVHV